MTLFILTILGAFIGSALCGFIAIPQILKFCARKNLYDIPNKRKMHKNKVPRLGGVSFLPSMLLAALIAILIFNNMNQGYVMHFSLWSVTFFLSLLIIYVTGLIDDLVGLGAGSKFIPQILAAVLMPLSGLWINNLYGLFGIYALPFFIGGPLTVFLLVFIVNAMNLIDGIDGLLASLSFIALSGFLFCFFREAVYPYCILIAGLMGVLIPYLYHNLCGSTERGNKIFMGDSGSLSVGFILGFLFVKFTMHNPHVMPFRMDGLMLSFTLLIVPCFDVARLIILRLVHGFSPFKADKNHIHHKLMRAGLTQHQALLVILLFAFFYIIVNMGLFKIIDMTWIVLVDVFIFLLFHYVVDLVIRCRGLSVFERL